MEEKVRVLQRVCIEKEPDKEMIIITRTMIAHIKKGGTVTSVETNDEEVGELIRRAKEIIAKKVRENIKRHS